MNAHYNVKSKVLSAFAHVLAPLARILIRNGISFYEFSELAKATFVKVCERDLCVADQPMTAARVSILTGLTRREIEDVKARTNQGSADDLIDDSVARVLQGWHEDKDFLGPYGVPRSLYYDSDPTKSPTFVDLVKRYREDTAPSLVLETLLRLGSVVRSAGDSTLQVTGRLFRLDSLDPGTFDWYANAIRRFIETSEANIYGEASGKVYQRWVFPDDGIRPEDWETFSKLVKERLEVVIGDLDSRFASLPPPAETDEERISVGVGMYVYRDRSKPLEG